MCDASDFQYRFDFPYFHGIRRGEVSFFDIRDIALAQHTDFRHGDRLARDGRYFTVIGVRLNEEGRPRVYTQADAEAGAAFHEGDFSQFQKVGTLEVAPAEPRSSTASSEQNLSEQMDRMLAKFLQKRRLDGSCRKKVAEIRQLLKGTVSGEDSSKTSQAPSCHLQLKPDFPVKLHQTKRAVSSDFPVKYCVCERHVDVKLSCCCNCCCASLALYHLR